METSDADHSTQKSWYASAGYKGVDFTLPAVETFISNIENGVHPEQLQVLYRTWAASAKQSGAAQRLYGRLQPQKQQGSSTMSCSKQLGVNSKPVPAAREEEVLQLQEPSLTLPKALKTVRLDHAVPLAEQQARATVQNVSSICVANHKTCSSAAHHFLHKYTDCGLLLPPTAKDTCCSNPLQQMHDASYGWEQQQKKNCINYSCDDNKKCQESNNSNCSQRQQHLSRFCTELAELHYSSTPLYMDKQQQQQQQQQQSYIGCPGDLPSIYSMSSPTLEKLKQVVEEHQHLKQQHGNWHLGPSAAHHVWELVHALPFFNRLTPTLGPAICQALLLQRLPAGSAVWPQASSSSEILVTQQPLVILLAGQLELSTPAAASNTAAAAVANRDSTMLGPGAMLNSCEFLDQAAAGSCSSSSASRVLSAAQQQQQQQHGVVRVDRQLAAEVLVLTADALCAAVKWWGAACYNFSWQQGALLNAAAGSARLGGAPWLDAKKSWEFFITQRMAKAGGSSCAVTAAVTGSGVPCAVQMVQELESGSCGDGSGSTGDGSGSSGDGSGSSGDGGGSSGDGSGSSGDGSGSNGGRSSNSSDRLKSSSASNGEGKYCRRSSTGSSNGSSSNGSSPSFAAVLSAWQVLPVQTQFTLLRCCSCYLLPAGQALGGPAGSNMKMNWDDWRQLGAGTLMQMAMVKSAGSSADDSAAAAAAARPADGSADAPDLLPPAFSQQMQTEKAATTATTAAVVATPAAEAGAAVSEVGVAAIGALGTGNAPGSSRGWQVAREVISSGSGCLAAAAAAADAQELNMAGRKLLAAAPGVNSSSSSSSARSNSSGSSSSSSNSSSSRWDELAAAALGPGGWHQTRTKTAAFKALSAQEQLQCLASWNSLQLLQLYTAAGAEVITDSPFHQAGCVGQQQMTPGFPEDSKSNGSSINKGSSNGSCSPAVFIAVGSNSGDNGSSGSSGSSKGSCSPVVLVAAEPCIVAAVEGVKQQEAAAALALLLQQALDRQAHKELAAKAKAAAADAGAAAACSYGSDIRITMADCEPLSPPAAAQQADGKDEAVEQMVHTKHHSISTHSEQGYQQQQQQQKQEEAQVPSPIIQKLEWAVDKQQAWQQQQQQQQEQEEAQVSSLQIQESELPVDKQQLFQPPPLSVLFAQPRNCASSLLAQFCGEEDVDSSRGGSRGGSSGNSSDDAASKGCGETVVQQQQQQQQQQQKNLLAALNHAAFSPSPLQEALMSAMHQEGMPEVQVYRSNACSSADAAHGTAGSKLASASVASTAGAAVNHPVQQAITAATAAAGAAAAGDGVRQDWIRSDLYDPFGMLRSQLQVSHRTSVQQQLHQQQRQQKPADPAAVTAAAAADGTATLATMGVKPSPMGLRSQQALMADSTYFGLSAASNQRRLGGSIVPGRQQIKQQVLQEEELLQQQQQQQQKGLQLQSTVGGAGAVGSKAASVGKTNWLRLQGSAAAGKGSLRGAVHAGSSSDSDDEEGVGLVPASAGGSGTTYDESWRKGHHRWSVPAYHSESGYVGGLYDESTGTMYMN